MKTTESIPAWALGYCINGDTTGLADEEISMIDKWMRDWHVEIISPITDEEGNYHPYFTHYPLFGLPTNVIDCDIIYHNPNPTNPQQL
ncbi:hypothetical protein [uncultured Duncaniella sp.]|jgi:hypothetical protein|uniref:DUF6926 domain-containing protein n=1 Tax=uncultured Duncaniella sp. TaxID=2768039 RepID=UPI0025B6C9A4|nr:hypothetical protein [uncultured Duncaniella sp.]